MSTHLQTPRRTNLRPSLANSSLNTASSPALSASQRTAFERKASLHALTGSSPARSADPPSDAMVGGDGQPLEVGDEVDVPGGMYGVVKFMGGVRGKKGTFAGVELAREFATKGKNDGDVDGTRYFTTSIPGAGIFLPLHRASKRASVDPSEGSLPPTPVTPGFGASFNLKDDGYESHNASPPPPVPKFSQSMGAGARAPKRPESPLRQPSKVSTTPGRTPNGRNLSLGLSKSQMGAPPKFSPTPSRSMSTRTPQPRKVTASRANSSVADTADEDDMTSEGGQSSAFNPFNPKEEELERLQKKLDETEAALKDRENQLKEQASSLADMESSLIEIQNLLPTDDEDLPQSVRESEPEDSDVGHLRVLLREKNERISILTAEFDMHRADFRQTIDALEMATSETVRVYEQRVEDLMAEVRELHERSEDVDSVAEQLKQLEELVQELEEGLEDARRGEAEARGEVEFLRGEVERGRSELRREREKAAAALKGATAAADGGPLSPGGTPREIEQRDDEIRGLKAIIQSLSAGGDLASPGLEIPRSPLTSSSNDAAMAELRSSLDRMERENEELRGLIERKAFREEELEREVENLRTQAGEINPARDSVISNTQSERSGLRDSKSTVVSWRGYQKSQAARRETERQQLARMPEAENDGRSSSAGQSELWCEICETGGHDILNCTNDLGGARRDDMLHPNEHHNELHLTPSNHSHLSARTSDDEREHRMEAERAAAITTPAPSDSITSGMRKLSVSSGDIDAAAANSPSPYKQPAPPSQPPQAALPNPFEEGLVAGKGQAVDADKWCALCERDGHDATACPFDDIL